MKVQDLVIDGRPVSLGRCIGKGGEGEVFELDDGNAVKLYKKPDAAREAKVSAMVSAGLASRSELIAFPLAVARRRRGEFAGFSMRLVKGHQPLFELYSPGARKLAFPKADYRFLVRAAANIARAVGKVHESSAVIGDINHSGILVSDRAVAALIDADSFQFGDRHLCRVGVPEYTPPELQGLRLERVVRTAAHDAFGLAVVMFQLLMMGRHPFVGRYSGGEMPIERAIREHRFAYSARSDTGMRPPPGAVLLTDFPAAVGEAFELAFGRDASVRPGATVWVDRLSQLERQLRACPNRPEHFHAAAGDCPWCRMEQAVGMILFLPPSLAAAVRDVPDPGEASFDLAAVWAAIERVQLPTVAAALPALPQPPTEPSQQVKMERREALQGRAWGVLCVLAAVAVLAGFPPAWFVYVPLGWYGLARLFGSPPASSQLSSRHSAAETAYHSAVQEWRSRVGLRELETKQKALSEAKARYAGLKPELERKLADQERKRREAQLRRYLETFLIRRARIKGIGPAREAALASYGVETAADVELRALLRVPGFGEASAKPLLEWRRGLESRFVFSQQPTPADLQAAADLRRHRAHEAAQLRIKLQSGAGELLTAAATITARLRAEDPVVSRAWREWQQARVDLAHLSVPVPPPRSIPSSDGAGQTMRTPGVAPGRTPPAPMPVTRTSPRSSAGATSCPRCGSRMVKRRNRSRGNYFWGCSRYPSCRGTRSS
jgi:DNA-binding helix-hairpin-helix protein with protein kinase domain